MRIKDTYIGNPVVPHHCCCHRAEWWWWQGVSLGMGKGLVGCQNETKKKVHVSKKNENKNIPVGPNDVTHRLGPFPGATLFVVIKKGSGGTPAAGGGLGHGYNSHDEFTSQKRCIG
jgi:hypothetical protein